MTEVDYQALARRGREDPVWWVREVLGHDPWDLQGEILESVRDYSRTAVRSCHGAGKSYVAAEVILWFLLNHPGSIVATTAPTFRQVEKIIWAEIASSVAGARKPLIPVDPLTTSIKLAPKWFAFGFATTDANAFQGLHAKHVLVVLDEAAGIPQEIWEGADAVLSAGHCRFLAIGNPTEGSGAFYEEFKQADTNKLKVSAFDTPNFTKFGITLEDIVDGSWQRKINAPLPYPTLVNPEWVAAKAKRWGINSPFFLSRILADFPDAAPDALIPLSWIEAAIRRELEPSAPSILALDVARSGANRSVLVHRKGPVVRILDAWQGADTTQTAGRTIQALREGDAKAVHIDADGLGAGVYDMVKETDDRAREFRGGFAAKDKERFRNLRAETFWALRERADPANGTLDLDDNSDLAAQLSSIKYKLDSKGRVVIESKDDMQKRGMESPDEADAVMMAFAELEAMEFIVV